MDLEPMAVDLKETARLIRAGLTKTRELVDTGEIESFTIGRAVRVPVAAIRAYVERQTATRRPVTTAPAPARGLRVTRASDAR